MATYGLTEQGFLAKRFDDIRADLKADIKTNFGIDLDSVPDNKFKILVNILSLPLAENWASAQALQSMMDIDQASGIFLDYLCASKLVYRQTGVKSSGEVLISINYASELTLPAGSSFYNNNNDEFLVTSEETLSLVNVHSFKSYIEDNYSGDIVMVLNGNTYIRNTATEGDLTTALDLLEIDLVSSGYFVERTLDGSSLVWTVRSVDNISAESPTFSLDLSSGFDLQRTLITLAYPVHYKFEGDFIFLAGSITITPAFSAIESFTNTVINGGRYRETDEEFRQRFKLSPSRLGKATASAIRSAMLSINGVSDVSVEENQTMIVDSSGRPPKSVEVVVKGGDDLEVAETLYDVVAAGIESTGSVSTEIRDVNQQAYLQHYSRVVNKYIWVQLTYVKYDEEEFPIDGAQLIQKVVIESINSLPIGKDVIQGRISANIYKNVGGIEVIGIGLFGSTDINATPVYSTTDPVRISTREEATQLAGNITVREA